MKSWLIENIMPILAITAVSIALFFLIMMAIDFPYLSQANGIEECINSLVKDKGWPESKIIM